MLLDCFRYESREAMTSADLCCRTTHPKRVRATDRRLHTRKMNYQPYYWFFHETRRAAILKRKQQFEATHPSSLSVLPCFALRLFFPKIFGE